MKIKRRKNVPGIGTVFCFCGHVLDQSWNYPGDVTIDICLHAVTPARLFDYLVNEAASFQGLPTNTPESRQIEGIAVHTVRMQFACLHLARAWNKRADDVLNMVMDAVKEKTGIAFLPSG